MRYTILQIERPGLIKENDLKKSKVWDKKSTLVVCLVGVLLIPSLILDWNSEFWLQHAFLSAFIAGTIPIILTVLIVDRWILARNEKQWSTVATVGLNGLGIYCSKYLEFLSSSYIDHKELSNLNHWDISTEFHTTTWSLMKYAKLSEARLLLTIFDSDSLPIYKDHPYAHMPKSRMLVLMSDPAWCAWFEQRSYDFRMEHYETVDRWTPIMMGSRQGREMLNYFAMLSRPLLLSNRRMKMIRFSDDPLDREWLFDQLFLLDVRTRRLANELWKFGDNPLQLMVNPKITDMKLREVFDTKNDDLLLKYC